MSLDSHPTHHTAATKRLGFTHPPAAPAEPVAGALIAGKYRLERLLGEGGGGSVWHATNLQLEVPVAIKLLRAGPTQRELGERLRLEARAVARLVHPSIVRVFDIGEAAPGEPFIVMELLSGESLCDRIYRDRPSAIEAVRLMLPIADALAAAHAAGVVHRDLKPDNVVLCPEGDCVRPKLLDFGVAKIFGGAKRANITQRGTLVGSPSYMSPEQARGSESLDFRTDIWSFCVVLYEALAGAMPFEAPDGGSLLRAVIQDAPKPLARVRGVDRQLWSLIEQGLSKPPSLRPSSMTELGRELARWLRRHGVETDAAGTRLDAKWLPRSGPSPAAQASRERTLMLVAEPAPRPPMGSFTDGHTATKPAGSTPGRQFVTRKVLIGPPRSLPRNARKTKPRDETLLVLGSTVATLLALFVGVLWAVGTFEDEPTAIATARFDAPAETVPVATVMAAAFPPQRPLPAAPAPPPPDQPTAEAPVAAQETPPAPESKVVGSRPAPAAAPEPIATPVSAPVSAPVPPLVTARAPVKAATAADRSSPASAKASPPYLTAALNSLAPATKKRAGGDGRGTKPRTAGPSTDLMVPY